MKIGVLQTGLVPDGFAETHGEYDAVFARLLHRVDPTLAVEGWLVVDGAIPDRPDAADGWIITGSKHGVYDDLPWIEPLKDFIRACAAARTPLIGVCFGHQIMAEALGGKAEKWKGGWRLGPEDYRLQSPPSWMADAPPVLKLHAVHQDQVTETPPDAVRLGASDGCANAILAYGAPEAPYAISIQPHPEFADDYAAELIALRRGNAFPEDASDRAAARLAAEQAETADWAHSDWAARWFVDFLRREGQGRAAPA